MYYNFALFKRKRLDLYYNFTVYIIIKNRSDVNYIE